MYKLKDIKITGFWGLYTINTSFHDDINIFIGLNGTGKTTFMNIMQAVLSVDVEELTNLQFESITINLQKGKSNRKIYLHKRTDDLFAYKSISFRISREDYEIPIFLNELSYFRQRSGRLHPQIQKSIAALKVRISEMIDLSFLSVHRNENIDYDGNKNLKYTNTNGVESRLSQLMFAFTNYQLQLESEISSLSSKFQKDVLISMLYNPEFDDISINNRTYLNSDKLDEIKRQLQNAYRELGTLDKKVNEGIELHVEKIAQATEAINRTKANLNKSIMVNHIAPLTLLNRTMKIISLSTKFQEEKQNVYMPINVYLNLLEKLIPGKSFETTQGGLLAFRDGGKFSTEKLSSGEKQLIILLTEVLLQKNKRTIFLADEPEISLHISWQRQILPSLIKLNPNAQIIVATHSPEIVGKWAVKTINMENIVYE